MRVDADAHYNVLVHTLANLNTPIPFAEILDMPPKKGRDWKVCSVWVYIGGDGVVMFIFNKISCMYLYDLAIFDNKVNTNSLHSLSRKVPIPLNLHVKCEGLVLSLTSLPLGEYVKEGPKIVRQII